MTKQMEERNAAEQRSASFSLDGASRQNEVRSFHVAVESSDEISYKASNSFFCFRHKLRRSTTELWWRSTSWKRSAVSWGGRSMLRTMRLPGESSLHSSVYLHHSGRLLRKCSFCFLATNGCILCVLGSIPKSEKTKGNCSNWTTASSFCR